MPNIHPTALVDPGAVLADDVEIGPYSIIENEVALGPACRIGPHCVIGKGTVLGADNRTFSGAQVWGWCPGPETYRGRNGPHNHWRP